MGTLRAFGCSYIWYHSQLAKMGSDKILDLTAVVFNFLIYTHLFRPSFSPSILVVTQIRGHIAGSPPPYPLRFVPCIIIARRCQPFLSSLTRVELRLPTLGVRSSLSFFIFANNFKILPLRDSNSWTNTSSIRGVPLQ